MGGIGWPFRRGKAATFRASTSELLSESSSCHVQHSAQKKCWNIVFFGTLQQSSRTNKVHFSSNTWQELWKMQRGTKQLQGLEHWRGNRCSSWTLSLHAWRCIFTRDIQLFLSDWIRQKVWQRKVETSSLRMRKGQILELTFLCLGGRSRISLFVK